MLRFTSHPLRIPDTLASTTVHFFERRRLRARIPPQRRNDNTLIQIEPPAHSLTKRQPASRKYYAGSDHQSKTKSAIMADTPANY